MVLDMDENKIYESLFRVFEREFSAIGEYIAFDDDNFSAYSVKIQELHLRICSEIENVLKRLVHKHFLSEIEVKASWEERKSKDLVKADKLEEYSSISESLNKKKMTQVDRNLFGFPDFAFYLEIASENISLDKKSAIFTSMLNSSSDKSVVTPFEIMEGSNVPRWWTAYNKLKHDKISNFSKCTLDDLVNSFAGLFILMVYLTKYYHDKPIFNEQMELRYSGVSVGCNYWDFEATHFQSTNTVEQNLINSFGFEQTITEERYDEYLQHFNKLEEKSLLNSSEKVFTGGRIKSAENAIFHVYVDYKSFASASTPPTIYRQKMQAAVFVN
ncbi:Uncharacterised protein [BD1-7 clade bacterium]|uniref:Uncharacterized protein n=1 Tax=BD1-7 clade bacterium TaxID=2029982 RepID=A0A5S9P622_9GAMM|nr:Uncharacterised protein [BD1-7 clade bacterium]